MRLSYTALTTFDQCRFWYRLRYLCGIRSAARPRMALSIVLHGALAAWCQGLQQEAAGPTADQGLVPGSLDALLDAFARQAEAPGRLTAAQCDDGRRLLIAYWRAHEGRLRVPRLVEAPFTVSVGPFRLIGRMDRVDGGDGDYEIVDYKLSRRVTGPPDLLQAYLYQLGLQALTGQRATRVSFYYLRPQQAVATALGPLAEAEDRIRGLCRAIAGEQAFAPTEGPWCASCDEQELCPAKTRSPRAVLAERRPRQLALTGVW